MELLDPTFDRSTGIGASESAIACGMSKYEQAAELYQTKIGEAVPKDETELMLFGKCIEAGGIRFWSELNETPVTYPLPTKRHPVHQFMFATPDAQIAPRRGLQFKSMDYSVAKAIDAHGLSEAVPWYVFQCQHEMSVYDWDEVLLVALVGRKLREWPIERNDRLINMMIEREAVFWDHVTRRVPPDIDFSKAGALKAVQALYPEVSNGSVVRLSDDSVAAWEAYEKLGKDATEIGKQREGYKAFVLNEIGENYGGLLPDGGRMVRRKLTQRKGYTVEPSEYIDVRAVKYDGSPVLSESYLDSDDSDSAVVFLSDIVDRIDSRLRAAGFILHEVSPAGSRYYVHGTEDLRFRVSDHEPNEKTAAWMARVDCRDIRTTDVLADVRAAGFGALTTFLQLPVSLS